MDAYAAFIERKSQAGDSEGIRPLWMPKQCFDFQEHMIEWALWKGRGALLEDCGLGKTLQELVWGENVVRHTNRPVLLLSPLAVTSQTAREAIKFGIEATVSLDGTARRGITLTNYEKLHLFDPNDFAGAICDESAILKSFDGVRRKQITDFMRKMGFRLLATATAAPNEYTELGTSSEALGYLGHMDMLSRFFKNNQGNSIKPLVMRHGGAARKLREELEESAKWRFKGHAEEPFWRWVCSWARALRKPSDLGFDDATFVLPPMIERSHMVEAKSLPDGKLFALPAFGLAEQREERRRTIVERCERAAELVAETGQQAVIWCHLNDEGDLLEKIIPGSIQVSGKNTDEEKVEKFLLFIDGSARVMVTKGKIGAWGLNLQNCAHSVSFPTHSFEEYYQQVRRFWRFGQRRSVVSDIVTTEGEKSVLANLQRKSEAADKMFSALIRHMNNALSIDRGQTFGVREEIPLWLS